MSFRKPDKKHPDNESHHPLFKNPEQYLRFRERTGIYRFFKRRFEWRSIELCLNGIDDISSVCDCPSGPGRLFEYWKKKGYKVTAVDFSDDMVKASKEELERYYLEGKTHFQDAFKLDKSDIERTDLVACVRFIYYFDKETRLNLLKKLAQFSRKYLLLQYKTSETLKGKKNIKRKLKKRSNKHHHKYLDIINELEQAGLDCIKIVPKGESSDRVFVLAVKKENTEKTPVKPTVNIHKPIRFHAKVAAAVIIFALLIGTLHQTVTSDPHERIIEGLVKTYQDGNDIFYVNFDSDIEDLRTNSSLLVINNLTLSIDDIIQNKKTKDFFFLIPSSELSLLKRHAPTLKLRTIRNIVIQKDHLVLLTTEKEITPLSKTGKRGIHFPKRNT